MGLHIAFHESFYLERDFIVHFTNLLIQNGLYNLLRCTCICRVFLEAFLTHLAISKAMESKGVTSKLYIFFICSYYPHKPCHPENRNAGSKCKFVLLVSLCLAWGGGGEREKV